jgi:hypothetical protein
MWRAVFVHAQYDKKPPRGGFSHAAGKGGVRYSLKFSDK